MAYCARHPGVETTLRCGRCEAAICPARCLVHAPGGIRCPDCARLRRPPMYELGAAHYLRAGAAAALGAAAMGLAAAIALPPRPGGGVLVLALALLGGAGAATLLVRAFDLATNRKRGRPLQLLAAAAFLAAALLRLALGGDPGLFASDAAGIAFAAAGAIVAWSRLA